jgi:23S rRNA (uracil1939-C5)-methyltransferase
LVEVTVERIGDHGDGIAETPQGRLYIPFTVPGDRVRVRPLRAKGDGLAAACVDLLADGPGRTQPPCAHFGRCGGCSLQHLADDAYAGWKRERLIRALGRAGFPDVIPAPLVRSPPGTRRRARFAVRRLRGKGVVAGFNVRDGHTIVDVQACPVLEPRIFALLAPLRPLMTELLAPAQAGEVTATVLEGGLDVLVDCGVALDRATRERLARFAGEAGVARLSWRRPGASVSEPLVQHAPVGATFAGRFVAVPPGSFLQATAVGEAALVAAVRQGIGPAPAVADLFCGSGTFAFPLHAAGARVHAVDADAAAVAALAATARGVAKISSEARDLFRRPLSPAELERFDAVVLDPPRAGALAQVRELARARVPVVVYVSCNPASFARDARTLREGGFTLRHVTPVDQFLWSAHLELAAVFARCGRSRSANARAGRGCPRSSV